MNSGLRAGAGFTIVETMIVLAVSGLMFVLAIGAMSGKQQQTEFQTGVDTLNSELNEELANVGNGNYPSLDGIVCTATSSGGQPDVTNVGASDGTCNVIGQAISFGENSNDKYYYTTYPVFGRTYVANTTSQQLATDMTDANPIIDPDISQTTIMPYGLQVTQSSGPATTFYPPASSPGAFGIFSFTSFAGSGGATYLGSAANEQLNSGSSHVEIFAIPNSTFSSTPSVTGLQDVGASPPCNPGSVCIDTANEAVNPTGGITFCVNSGTTSNESALFTIGGASDLTSSRYQIYGQSGCS